MSDVTITLTLSPECAAGLKRFAEKISFDLASSVLYPHVSAEIRGIQAGDILAAFAGIDKALGDAHVSAWPWIDTGIPRT